MTVAPKQDAAFAAAAANNPANHPTNQPTNQKPTIYRMIILEHHSNHLVDKMITRQMMGGDQGKLGGEGFLSGLHKET